MTRSILSAALLFAAVANANPVFTFTARTSLSQTGTTGTTGTGAAADDDEEDEDEETPVKPTDTATDPNAEVKKETPPATDAKASPETNLGTVTAPEKPAGVNADAQKLVSGAPLYNPNVAVHIVEKKAFSDKGKNEIVLYPAAVQVNGKFTNHAGTALTYAYHLQENFAFQVSPIYNWFNAESPFNQELIDKARVEAQAATSLLLVYGATAGVEVTPLYGKFSFYENQLAHFSLVLSGGAGAGNTRHQLKPFSQTETDPARAAATYGDTGMKFMGQVGGGFRVQLGQRFALRLEVRDLVYTARVDSVNGCDLNDLNAIKARTDAGDPASNAAVRGSCKIDRFAQGDIRSNVNLARNLVATPSSDVLNNVGFYLGAGFIF